MKHPTRNVINISNITLHFGERPIFDEVSFQVNEQDRIGLVGRNGAGKSTMLKVIAGQQKPNEGEVSRPNDYTIGYLPQEIDHYSDETVFREVAGALKEEHSISERIDEIQAAFDKGVDDMDEMSELLEEFNSLNERYQLIGAGAAEENIERILKGLGFERSDFSRPLSEFSGGWKMRVELAKILLTAPDLLLLDEPTNHLDIDSIQWLEEFLSGYSGAIILISHDIAFLDGVTNRTIEIVNGKIRDYNSNYSGYLTQRELIVEKQIQDARNQEKYVKETEQLINKFRAKASKASFAQSLIKKLDKLDKIEVDDDQLQSLNLNFGEVPRSGKVPLKASGLEKSYGENHLFSDVGLELERGEKVALIGKNGIGKTTLLRILVGDEKATGEVEIGHNVHLGYFAQHQTATLDDNLTVFEVIDQEATGDMRTKVRGLLGTFLFRGDDIYKKVKVLSGGEKSRLALCRLMLHPYNMLIMDEPTNHLDIDSKEILKQALINFKGTLLIVSHDRQFLQGLTDKLFEIQAGGLKIHYDDINTFLKQRNAENIAQFERVKTVGTKKSETASKSSSANKRQSDKEVKKLRNRVSKLENEVADLEKKLDILNKESAEMDFSDQEKVRLKFEEVSKVKKQLEETEQKWENAVLELEEAEKQIG